MTKVNVIVYTSDAELDALPNDDPDEIVIALPPDEARRLVDRISRQLADLEPQPAA